MPTKTTHAKDVSPLFRRTADQYFSKAEFDELLASGKKLRIKYGVDVTAPFLHLGHAVNLWMMRELQDMGHKVVFLIGDFTTRIGDPTGKSETRPVIARPQIEKNAKEFIKQVGTVLRTDERVFEVRRNSEWYDKMKLQQFMELLSSVTHAHLISRDMFQTRIAQGREIHMHEMLYPILQGYDSVMLKADATIVGSDQLFNEMMGRFYQEKAGQKPQAVITTKITPGTDGKEKQSKSLGNYVALADSPRDKFGKIMSIPDALVAQYLEMYTTVPDDKIAGVRESLAASANPRDAKLFLAEKIVERYHGEKAAAAERDYFISAFSKREIPGDIPELAVAARIKALDLLKAAMPEASNGELRRLVKQGAVELGGVRLGDTNAIVEPRAGDVLKIGKRHWWKIVEGREKGATRR